MKRFAELALPAEETASAVWSGSWFVTIKHLTASNKGILATDGSGIEQAQQGADHSRYYFDSELQAFSVSSLFYTNNGYKYPYMSEWDDAKKNEFNKNAAPGAGTLSQSEVMDFI